MNYDEVGEITSEAWENIEISLYGKTYDTYLAQTILSGMGDRLEDAELEGQFL